jgi:phage shock protein E
MRTLTAALALTLLLPATALAQDSTEPSPWPTAAELRGDLQDIGYQFSYDASSQAFYPEFHEGLPTVWSLTQPVLDRELAEVSEEEAFTLQLVEAGELPTQVVFGATSVDGGAGELETVATVLMEVASRLPQESQLDAAVWYISNLWTYEPGAPERTTMPCLLEEFEGGSLLVWLGGDGQSVISFFGTVGPYDFMAEELEQCRTLLGQAAAESTGAAPTTETEPAEPTVDYTVPPEEAVAMIEAGERVVIDVRTPAEYEQAHVVGALNIDVEAADFGERIAELDADVPYLLYCRTGRRSDLAAQQMAAAGFSDIADGAGLAGLARAGAPVE